MMPALPVRDPQQIGHADHFDPRPTVRFAGRAFVGVDLLPVIVGDHQWLAFGQPGGQLVGVVGAGAVLLSACYGIAIWALGKVNEALAEKEEVHQAEIIAVKEEEKAKWQKHCAEINALIKAEKAHLEAGEAKLREDRLDGAPDDIV